MRLSIVSLAIILLGCSKGSDPNPGSLVINGNMEIGSAQPNSWIFYSTKGNIMGSWTTDAASSPSHSLEASLNTIHDASEFAYWRQQYTSTKLAGKNLVLTVKIKGANLVGTGAAIAIRTDNQTTVTGYALQFSTTQGNTPISGTFDWTTYTVRLPNVGSTTQYITVFLLLLNNTTGAVYFDDANLTVE